MTTMGDDMSSHLIDVWSTTLPSTAKELAFMISGNLVVYSTANKVLW